MNDLQYQAEIEQLDEEEALSDQQYQHHLAELEKRPESLKCQQAAHSSIQKLEKLHLKRRNLERRHNLAKEQQAEKTKKNDESATGIVTGLQEYFGEAEYEQLVMKCGEPVEQTLMGFNLNDVWWGAVALHNREILFSPNYDEFYEYDDKNGLWFPITENKLTSQLHDLIVLLNRKVFKKTSILKHVHETFRHNAIKSQRGGEKENKTAFINKKLRYVQVQNGVLDFTGKKISLKPFAPSYYALHACPLAYDPKAKCPKFLALTAHLQPHDVDALQRAAGQFLLGRNLTQKIFLFEGVGNSRKSTITNVIKLVIGSAAVTQLRTEHLNDRFELYRVYQKSLLIGSDVQEDFLMKDGAKALKRLTGGDPLTAEGKNSNQGFDFDGDLNVLVNANSRLLLRLQSDADAWTRRLVLIYFPCAGDPQNNKPEYWNEIFREEGAGVLRWMVEGAQRLLQDIKESKGFILTEEQKKRVTMRIEESDSIGIFLQACIILSENPNDGISTEEIMQRYGKFCAERKWVQPPSQTVTKRLSEKLTLMGANSTVHIPKVGSAFGVRGYTGIKWKSFQNDGNGTDEGMQSGGLESLIKRFR